MPDVSLYDDVAEIYDSWVGTDLNDPILDELVKVSVGDRVCVVACGSGRDARYMAGRGALVEGIDLSANLIQIAKEREYQAPLGVSYTVDDAQDLITLNDESFQGALCHMALMDIPDLEQTLASIVRVLLPGGWFVFSITHPCYKTLACEEVVDHVDGSVRRTVGKYFDEGPWPGPGAISGKLPSRAYHRTLSTYVNALATAGLDIQQMREPKLNRPVWQQAACLLYVQCRKR